MAKVTVSTFNNLGSNTNDEISVVLIKHGVQSLPDEDRVSWDWFKYMTKFWWKCIPEWCSRSNKPTKHITFDQLHGKFLHCKRSRRGNTRIGTWHNGVYIWWYTWHQPFIILVANQWLETGYTSILVLQTAEQVGVVVGDNPCKIFPCPLIIIFAIQRLGTQEKK